MLSPQTALLSRFSVFRADISLPSCFCLDPAFIHCSGDWLQLFDQYESVFSGSNWKPFTLSCCGLISTHDLSVSRVFALTSALFLQKLGGMIRVVIRLLGLGLFSFKCCRAADPGGCIL